MPALKDNLLFRFSLASLGIMIVLAVTISTILGTRLDHYLGLLTDLDTALIADVKIEPTDQISVPSLVNNHGELHHELKWTTYGSVGGGFVILYVSLVTIVGRGSRTISKQTRRLEAINAELETSVKELFETNQQLNVEIAQRTRAKSEIRLQAEVMENMVEAVCLVRTTDGAFVYVAPKFEEMFGYAHHELIGKPASVVNAPGEQPDAVAGEVIDGLDQRGVWAGEVHCLKKDGTTFWGRTTISTFEHHDFGTVWVSVLNDVTSQKKAEEALRESEERYWRWVEDAADAFFVIDNDGKFIDVNQTACGSLGYEREELIGLSVADISLNMDEGCTREVWRQLSTATCLTRKAIHIRKDRSTFPVEVRSGLIEIGGHQYLFSLARDETERQNAETSLRRQNEILETIFDNIPVMLAFYDAGGRVKLINKELESTLGWSLQEWQSRDLLAECYPDPQYLKQVVDYMVSGGRAWKELKTVVRDGRTIDTAWYNVKLSDGSNLGLGQDITERKRTEEALRESEERYRDLFEEAPLCYFTVELDGQIRTVNSRVYDLLGYTPDSLISRSVVDLYADTPMGRERALQLQQRIRANEEIRGEVMEMRAADGRSVWVSLTVHLIRDGQGQPIEWRAIVLDITEQKRAQDELRESDERLSKFFEYSNDAILLVDPERDEILEVNPKACSMLGYSREQLLSIPLSAVHPNEVFKLQSFAREVLEEGHGWTDEITGTTRTGQMLHLEMSASMANIGGRQCIISMVRDITDRKRGEKALRKSEQRIRKLAAACVRAHEEERQWIALEVHDRISQRLFEVFQQLLKLETITRDDIQGRKEVERASALLREAITESRNIMNDLYPAGLEEFGLIPLIEDELQRFSDETGCLVEFNHVGTMRPPREVEVTLYRIFHEALANIRRHAHGAKDVTVSFACQGGLSVLEVQDYGPGFDLESATKELRVGGLKIMRRRAEIIGGTCELRSTIGQGTRLTIRIPIKKAMSKGRRTHRSQTPVTAQAPTELL